MVILVLVFLYFIISLKTVWSTFDERDSKSKIMYWNRVKFINTERRCKKIADTINAREFSSDHTGKSE